MSRECPIPALGNRVLIDPEATLIILSDPDGNPINEIVRPIEVCDADGARLFGPGTTYPFVRAIVSGFYFAADDASDPLFEEDPETVIGIIYISPTQQIVKAPLEAIIQDLGEEPFPPKSEPSIHDEIFPRHEGLRRAYIPIYTDIVKPFKVLEIESLRKDIIDAFAVPDAAEVHWIHDSGIIFWAEKDAGGWSTYIAGRGEVLYWSGDLLDPPAHLYSAEQVIWAFFQSINHDLFWLSVSSPEINSGRLEIYRTNSVPLRREAILLEDFLLLVGAFKTKS